MNVEDLVLIVWEVKGRDGGDMIHYWMLSSK